MRFEPYSVAHDQQHAGLRDYLALPGGDEPPSMRWLILATLIALVFAIGFFAGRAA